MRQMTLREAYMWVLLKWRYIVQNDGDDYHVGDHIPELRNLDAFCGYCFYYDTDCERCPLRDDDCFNSSSIFQTWVRADIGIETLDNAKKMLEFIQSTRPDEIDDYKLDSNNSLFLNYETRD